METEKEMLSVVYNIDKLKYSLLGKHFIIETDNQAFLS